MTRLALAVAVALALAGAAGAAEQPVSAFAGGVGARTSPTEPAPPVKIYEVPDGRTFLLTDVLIANHSQEVGPLYLGDTERTRCAIELLQRTFISGGPGVLDTFANVHTSFSTGIVFGPGEPVLATLAGGTHGVDVTISGKLVPGPRAPHAVRLQGGAREGGDQGQGESGAR